MSIKTNIKPEDTYPDKHKILHESIMNLLKSYQVEHDKAYYLFDNAAHVLEWRINLILNAFFQYLANIFKAHGFLKDEYHLKLEDEILKSILITFTERLEDFKNPLKFKKIQELKNENLNS
jgi:hypothetical protein